MRIDHIEAFVAICQTNSINKAADILKTSPQNTGKLLRQFENYFNITLVNRLPTGISLTTEGKEVLEFSKETLHKLKCLKDNISKTNQNELISKIFLISSPSQDLYYLEPLLRDFKLNFFNVDFSTLYTSKETSLSFLNANSKDHLLVLPVVCSDNNVANIPKNLFDHYRFIPIHYDKLVIVTSKNSPFKSYKTISIKKIKNEKIILPTSYNDDNYVLEYLTKALNTSKFNYITKSRANYLEYVRDGSGISFVCHDLFVNNPNINTNDFHIIYIREESNVTTYLVTLLKSDVSIALQQFLDYVTPPISETKIAKIY